MSFLPDDYKVPASNTGFMKFQQGENVFRILSDAIIGWEWWTTEVIDGKEVRRPNRVTDEEAIPVTEYNEDQPPKHFWAMVVWNYQDKKIQVLEITQKGIQKAIRALEKSKGWGEPKRYDISVTKTGEKLETEYSVMPIPPEPLDKEIEAKFKATKVNLAALYSGDDPFDIEEHVDVNEITTAIDKGK
jgi:hypothetical protein